MKKYCFFITFFFILVLSVFSQNNIRNWITSIDRAIEALSIQNQGGNSPYLIRGNNNSGFIVYDVYGFDVEILSNGDASITRTGSLAAVNNVHSQFFEAMLMSYGRPTNTNNNGGILTTTFSGGQASIIYELQFNPFASTISLTKRLNRNERPGTRTIIEGESNINNFLYDTTNNSIIITGYNGTSVNINIPSVINGMPVVEIGEKAFLDKGIQTLQLPNSIRIIGDQAFHRNQITELIIPEGVTTIGVWAFARNRINSLTLPSTLIRIGQVAFLLNNLTSINVPNSVTFIGDGAFASNQINTYIIPNNFIFIQDSLFEANHITEVIIPDGIITIRSEAFWNNRITNVVIPNSVREIYSSSFRDNPINRIVIGNNVRLSDTTYNPSFPFNFANFYNENDKKAGVYIYQNNSWSYTEN